MIHDNAADASPEQQGPADTGKIASLDILILLTSNLRLLIALPLAVAVAVYLGSMLLAPTFTATARILPPQQQQSLASNVLQSIGALGGIAGAAAGLKNPSDQYISFIKSNSVLDALVSRFSLKERYGENKNSDARAMLDKNTRVMSGKDNIISIEFDDTDPKFAASVANGYVTQLERLLNRLSVTEAQQRRVFFGQQLESTKGNLVKAEQALSTSGVSVATLNSSPNTAVEATARLRAMINVQEVRLASMRSYLAAAAPEYKQAETELATLKGQMARLESSQPVGGAGSNDYIAKYREFKYQETLFELFARQYELARVDESRDGSIVQVLDPAETPEKKSGPKKAVIAIAAFLISMFLVLTYILISAGLASAKAERNSALKMLALKSAWRKTLGLKP